VLALVLVALGIALAIAPLDRKDWALENALAVLTLVALAATYSRFRLSNLSYTALFVFLVIHEVGAHYTYAKVPYDEAWRSLTGRSFDEMVGWKRNQYDRVVHFAYGLLIAYPMRELFVRVADARGFWGYFLPLDIVMSTSMLYEVIEWGAAAMFGGDLGVAYLGTQGDVWDAQKDMLCATVGAVIAMTITAVVHRALDRDFQREWADSLRIRRELPMGEDEIARLRAK
jgi:putative membrane protein